MVNVAAGVDPAPIATVSFNGLAPSRLFAP